MRLTSERARELGKKSSRKGVKNKSTTELREMFKLFLENNWDNLQSDMDKLDPYERIKVMLDFAQYVVPKLRSTEIQSTNEEEFKPVVITGVTIK